jgi:hypothetical protein
VHAYAATKNALCIMSAQPSLDAFWGAQRTIQARGYTGVALPDDLASPRKIIVTATSAVAPAPVDVCLANSFMPLADAPSSFPRSVAELTTDWLSQALGAKVKSMDLNASDEGQLGLTVIVNNIEYENEQPERPSSVAIKLHCQEDGQLGMAVTFNAYCKEMYFYTQLQATLPLATPTALGVWTDGNPLENITGAVGTDTTHFCLMMENLVDAGWSVYAVAPGDKSPSYDQLLAMLPSMVKLHSTFWESPALMNAPLSVDSKFVNGASPLLGSPRSALLLCRVAAAAALDSDDTSVAHRRIQHASAHVPQLP